MNKIINKDLYAEGQLNPSEVLTVLRYLISKHGLEPVKKVYEELKTTYFLDITEKRLGTLKWDENLVYFDRTTKKPPFRTEGEMQISASRDIVVRFRYVDNGLRRYDDILLKLKESLRTEGVSFVKILVGPSMSLKETDGSLRKEIKEILGKAEPLELSKN